MNVLAVLKIANKLSAIPIDCLATVVSSFNNVKTATRDGTFKLRSIFF